MDAAPAAKPTAPAGPSLIQRLHGTEESFQDRMLKKHVPAWVVSGAVHAVILAIMILIGRMGTAQEPTSSELIRAVVDAPTDEEKQKDLTNVDIGLESDLKSVAPNDNQKDLNVDAKVVPDEVPGVPSENTTPLDVPSLAGLGPTDNLGRVGEMGEFLKGAGGNSGLNIAPGFQGRSGATRDKLAKAGGGNEASEAAVALGLAWLARQQRPQGQWVFDGSSSGDVCAATGMALLPFLAAGQTHKPAKGNTYQPVVQKGLDYLLALQNPSNGRFRTSRDMYSHSIATVALCELYGMTGDKKVLYPAKQAIDFIVKAQAPDGSWGYQSGMQGDTSIVGWAIQALKSAEMCKDIPFPKTCYEKARKFLDSVAGANDSLKSTYGYRDRARAAPGTALTAVGLLCRYYMDGWGPVHPGLQEGVQGMLRRSPPSPERFNMYYYYYATQVVHFHEGEAWFKEWNPRMRDMLIKLQVPRDKPEAIRGSWDKDNSPWIGEHCGRLGTTCMALLTLEVYYRHLPLYKRGTDGKQELERVK